MLSSMLSSIFEASRYITTPISLLAFIGAGVFTYLLTKNNNERKKIELAPENERSDLIKTVSEKLRLDIKDIPEHERAKIVIQTLRNRVLHQVILAVSILLGGIIFSYILLRASGMPAKENKDSKIDNNSFTFTTISVGINGQLGDTISLSGKAYVQDLDGVQLELVEIPGGTFYMGTDTSEIVRYDLVNEISKFYPGDSTTSENHKLWPYRETPKHLVTVSPFKIGKFEITQRQWKKVAKLPLINYSLHENPSVHIGDNKPVECVSFRAAEEFCNRLSRYTGKKYRLPTEAEWEYACRAGSTSQFSFGDNIQPSFVNYDGGFPFLTVPRGIYRNTSVDVGSLGYANRFGIYDMPGNVWEWCSDLWHADYRNAPTDGSAWLEESGYNSEARVVRGGSWYWFAYGCRSAYRNFQVEYDSSEVINGKIIGNHGLRVVLENE